MHVVIFEVRPKPDRKQDYFDYAAALKSELEQIDGFISVERFASMTEEGKVVSLSFWRDEAAIKAWRETLHHRQAQKKGRQSIFEDYRLRIAEVVRDYGMTEREEAPQDLPEKLVPQGSET